MNPALASKYARLTDREIINRIITKPFNEEAAAYLLYERYSPKFRKLCRDIYGTCDVYYDCVDDLIVFLKGHKLDWDMLRSFEWRSKFSTCIGTTASRRFMEIKPQLIGKLKNTFHIDRHTSPNKGKEVFERRIRRVICLIFVFFFLNCGVCNATDFFQRHYLVLVDQTYSSMREDPEGLAEIGKILSNIFLGNDLEANIDKSKINNTETYLSDLKFNPELDELSVFKFGITGNGNALNDDKYGLSRIRRKVKCGENELKAFTDEFITLEAEFRNSGMEISDFVRVHFTPLFYGEGINPGMNYSSIVYPCVLKTIAGTPAASEYFIIIVSNFKVQGGLDNRADYGTILTAMCARSLDVSHAEAFAKQLWQIKAPFYTTELVKIQSLRTQHDNSNQTEHINAVKASCFKVGVKSLEGVSTYVASNLDLKQIAYRPKSFSLSPVSITFTHDEHLRVNDIKLCITDSRDNVIFEKTIEHAEFDEIERQYVLSGAKITFSNKVNLGDKIHFRYIFKITPEDQAGNAILPFVFFAERDLTLSRKNFNNPLILTIFMYLLFLAIFTVVLLWVYFLIKRGQKNKCVCVELEHSDADEGTFQLVNQKRGALLLRCNYPRNGATQITYTLQGRLYDKPGFVIPWGVNYVYVKANLVDAQQGVKITDPNDWMYVLVKEQNRFTFEIQLDFQDCEEELKEVQVWLQWKFEPKFSLFGENPFAGCGIGHVECEEDFVRNFQDNEAVSKAFLENVTFTYNGGREVIHNFIRKPFENPDHWVGIDPGTSGSCISIGCAAGSHVDNPNIARVLMKDGAGRERSIINSLISFGGLTSFQSEDKELNSWEPGINYNFGIDAYEHLDEYVNGGAYCYQSIKKLLGYKKNGRDGSIMARVGKKDYRFSGLDLQMLLVRALTKKVISSYIYRIKDEDTLVQLRESLFPNITVGDINPEIFKRAVVAIPNNYQLPQILDMVDSVKRNGFEEVKYIYEPEGILFHYLKETFHNHNKDEIENIIVFDMGGATINATVFKVDIRMNGCQPEYHISTLSRLGYAIGGDDIDYAIIEYLMHFHHISSQFKDDAERYAFQDKNKTKLINLAQKFKKDFVRLSNHKEVESLKSIDNFCSVYLQELIKQCNKSKEFMTSDLKEDEKKRLGGKDFSTCLQKDLLDSSWMKEYVYGKIEDSVNDMMSTPDVRDTEQIHKIIFSGRSTMFPEIKENVKDKLKREGRSPQEYEMNGDLKSPVADGACWYGIFEGKVVFLDNSRVTSSYGFCHTIPGQVPYHELIQQNSKYEINNGTAITRSLKIESNFNGDGGYVNFYQVMGALQHKNSLYDESSRHKVRFLNSINLNNSTAREVTITVCSNGQVICDADYSAKPQNQENITAQFDARDITQENARPYLFSICDLEVHKIMNVKEEMYNRNARGNQYHDKINKNGSRRF